MQDDVEKGAEDSEAKTVFLRRTISHMYSGDMDVSKKMPRRIKEV